MYVNFMNDVGQACRFHLDVLAAMRKAGLFVVLLCEILSFLQKNFLCLIFIDEY